MIVPNQIRIFIPAQRNSTPEAKRRPFGRLIGEKNLFGLRLELTLKKGRITVYLLVR